MNDTHRIGLVEVGSSTIRYLVADFDNDMSFVPKKIETIDHDLHPSAPTEQAIVQVNRIVERCTQDARDHGCDSFLAYGTAGCRTASMLHPGALTSTLKVLSPAEEAIASWVAGFLCVRTSRDAATTCTIIDEGSGSTEIVRATWSGACITDVAFNSTAVGSIYLMDAYKTNPDGHIALIVDLISKIKDELRSAGVCPGKPGSIYLLGSVATRIGWLASGKTGADEYRPDKVNGVRVTRNGLIQLHKTLSRMHAEDPNKARRFVDVRRGREQEALRVLGSTPFLLFLASHLDARGQFFISGYGVRHGMAFLIKRGLIVT
jgi:exopolyphosphatase/pppGpp-phosphohydrolase